MENTTLDTGWLSVHWGLFCKTTETVLVLCYCGNQGEILKHAVSRHLDGLKHLKGSGVKGPVDRDVGEERGVRKKGRRSNPRESAP